MMVNKSIQNDNRSTKEKMNKTNGEKKEKKRHLRNKEDKKFFYQNYFYIKLKINCDK